MFEARRRFVILLSAVALLGVGSPAHLSAAQARDAGLFFWQVDRLQDWRALQAFYSQRPACPDEQLFAQAYSDVVLRDLVEHWAQLPELQTLSATDPGFRAFVLQHIDAVALKGQLRQALSNATTLCPAGAEALCKDIAERASRALQEKPPH